MASVASEPGHATALQLTLAEGFLEHSPVLTLRWTPLERGYLGKHWSEPHVFERNPSARLRFELHSETSWLACPSFLWHPQRLW